MVWAMYLTSVNSVGYHASALGFTKSTHNTKAFLIK